jgi:hypothetical protein
MITERIDCYPAHLRIFSTGVVSGNHSLNFVAQGFVERALTGNGSTSCSLSSAPRFKNFTSTL